MSQYRHGFLRGLLLLLSVVVLAHGAPGVQASQAGPQGDTGVLPDAAPQAAWDPPYIGIARQGATIVLDWSYESNSIKKYEVWRSENPYFNPASGQGTSLGLLPWGSGGIGTAFQFIDNGSCGNFIAGGQSYDCQTPQNPTVTVVGDKLHNYFWVVRAGDNTEWQFANRVGEFDFGLQPGS